MDRRVAAGLVLRAGDLDGSVLVVRSCVLVQQARVLPGQEHGGVFDVVVVVKPRKE